MTETVVYKCPRCNAELLLCDYNKAHRRWACWECKSFLESYQAITVVRDGVETSEIVRL